MQKTTSHCPWRGKLWPRRRERAIRRHNPYLLHRQGVTGIGKRLSFQKRMAKISHLPRNRSFFGVFEVPRVVLQGIFAQKCQSRMDKRKKPELRAPLMVSHRTFPPVRPLCTGTWLLGFLGVGSRRMSHLYTEGDRGSNLAYWASIVKVYGPARRMRSPPHRPRCRASPRQRGRHRLPARH